MENSPRKIENVVGEGEIGHYEKFLLLPQSFQDLYCRHVRIWACFGKG